MKWTVSNDAAGDPRLFLLPLRGAVSRSLAAELIRDGYGICCGQRGKPFTAVRKWRSIGRVTHVDLAGGLYSTAWLLCGRCTNEMKSNGGHVSEKLLNEARAAASAGQLMMLPAEGNA